jgi:hypothetical protein
MREGWHQGGYDAGRAMALPAIAKRKQLKPSTALNHYRPAFLRITGYDYSLEACLRNALRPKLELSEKFIRNSFRDDFAQSQTKHR